MKKNYLKYRIGGKLANKKNLLFISISLIVLLIVLSGCARETKISLYKNDLTTPELPDVNVTTTEPVEPIVGGGSPTPPTRIELSISKAPALGETTEIMATITYMGRMIENIPETTATIILPEGFELVSGNPIWKGYVKNEPQQFSIIVKAVKIGNWTIETNARSPPTGRGYIGGRDWIYVSVLEDGGIVSNEPFPLPKREGSDRAIKMNDSEIPPETNIPYDENITKPEPTEQVLNS